MRSGPGTSGSRLAALLFAATAGAAPQTSGIEAARRLVAEGRLEEAVPHLDRARKANPGDPAPLWMLAVARLRLGNLAEAASLAAEFADRVPESPNGPLLQGTALSALGDLEGAEAALREALGRDPQHPEARRDLAILLGRRGEREEAIARLEALEAEYPGRPEALAPLGVLYVQAGRGADGLAALLSAAQVDPASFEAQHHLGALYSGLGQYEPAGRRLEAALALRPGDPGTLLEICLLRSREERLEDARGACARAASAAPENAEAQFASGDVLHYLQEEEAAARAYRAAIRLDPDHARARFRLGLLLFEAGRTAEAIPVLTPAVESEAAAPEHLAGGLTTLGRALAASDPDAAARRLREAIDVSPTVPEPHLHLGNLLARSEDAESAAEGRRRLARFAELRRFSDRTNELKAAINANPGGSEPKTALIAHLILGGAPRHALRESERLLTLAAAEPLHHLLHAESLAALGRLEEARAALDRALVNWPAHPELLEAAGRLNP